MDLYLTEIVAVAGKPGLHKVIGKRSNGLIVESLEEQPKRFPTSINQKVSFLSDISMYTYEGDEKLAVVLQKLHEKVQGGLVLIDKKSSGDEIRAFFRKVLETFDEDQVYNSDILKLVTWYDILKDKVDFSNLIKSEEEELEKNEEKPEKKSTKKAPKSTVKKAPAAPKAQTKAKSAVKKAGNLKSGKS